MFESRLGQGSRGTTTNRLPAATLTSKVQQLMKENEPLTQSLQNNIVASLYNLASFFEVVSFKDAVGLLLVTVCKFSCKNDKLCSIMTLRGS